VQGTTTANFGAGIIVVSLTVNSLTTATVALNIDRAATLGPRSVSVTTGMEVASLTAGFAVSPGAGSVFVSVGSMIGEYDASGAFVRTFIAPGSGGLTIPEGMVFGPDGNLYISNGGPTTSSILRYNGLTGAFIDTFVPVGTPEFIGMTFGPNGNLFVADFSGGVKEYDGKTGQFIRVFATPPGTGPNNAIQPLFGPDGNFYLGDQPNDVEEFNPVTGAFIRAFPSAPGPAGMLPITIAFGPDGNLYVGTFGQCCPGIQGEILKYDLTTGALLGVFVQPSSGGLQVVQELVFRPDGYLYVTSSNTAGIAAGNQILRFDATTGAFVDVFIGPGAQGLPGIFAFAPDTTPSLSSLVPASGQQGQTNLAVTITGRFTHFVQGTSVVNLGSDIVVNSVTVTAATSLTMNITIPGTATLENHTVTVTTGSEVATLAGGFSVQPGTLIQSVTPNSGQEGQQNLSVSITGQNTNFVQGTTMAIFGAGITVTSLTVNSATSAVALINIDPAAALGARDVTLTTGSEVATLPGGFTVTAPITVPSITNVSPNSGPQGQGGPVAIAGQNTHFVQGTTQVDFGAGITVSNISVTCPTCLTVELQISATATPGARTVTVTTGSEVVSLANGFTVQPGTPIIVSFGPTSAQQGQTIPLTVNGQFTHFTQGTTQVSLGAGVTVSNITVASTTSLTAQIAIDPNAAVGTRTLSVTTGSEVVSVPNVFNVQLATPILLTLNPGGGQQGQQNLSVAITGLATHFAQGTSQASFGAGVTVVSLTVTSPTAATAVINIDPAATLGTRTVTVTTGTEVASFTNGFTVSAAVPSIVSVNPNAGQQGQQSESVAITGQFTHFVQGTTTASFGAGITVASLTVNSPTTATAVININAAAPVSSRDVTLTTGSEIAILPSGFNVTSSSPAVSQLSPNTGEQGQQNLQITITGQSTHFVQGTTTASFGAGITVASLTVNSATTATVVMNIDPTAAPGARNVTFTTGAEVATLNNGFTITNGTPVITQVSPNSSPQGLQNLSVQITGQFTHFAQGTTQVSFGTGGVTVNSVSVTNAGSLTANISIALNQTAGASQ
jgi:hypothetical protein